MPQPETTESSLSEVILIYITMPSLKSAEALGREILSEKLAACINITPGMLSLYHWEGSIESSSEAVMIAKTSRSRAPLLREYIETNHPYDTPCILAIPVEDEHSSPAYMKWLTQNLVND